MKSITCRHCGTPRKASAHAPFRYFCPTCKRVDDPLGRADLMLEYIAAWMIALVLAMGVAYIAIDLFCLLSSDLVRTVPETAEIRFVSKP
jgi:hypothetical protein